MPVVLRDRVRETTDVLGTASMTLNGPVFSYQSFSVVGNGNTTYYTITNNQDWEVGIGTYTAAGSILSRDVVLESSNGGARVNWAAGTKDVFLTYPADLSVYVENSYITSSPAAGIIVAAGSVSAPAITVTGDPNTGIFFPAADTLAFVEGGTEVMRINSSGNVGIGTVAPTTKLDVAGNVRSSTGTSYTTIGITGGASYLQAFDTSLTNIPLTFLVGVTERMRIDTSGNVGIGTSAPQVRLHVAATSPTRGITSILGATGSTGVQLQMTQAAIEDWVIGQPAGVSAFAIWSGRNVGTDGTERMRIDASGNLGLGVTPSAWGTLKAMQFPVGSVAGYDGGTGNRQINFVNNAYFDGSAYKYVATDTAQRYTLINGEHQWLNAPSGTAGNAISFAQAMKLDASSRLVLNGTDATVGGGQMVVNHGANNGLVVNQTGSGTGAQIYLRNAVDSIINGINFTNPGVRFYDIGTATERMRIDTSGNVGIGTTSPSGKLDVVGDGVTVVASAATNTATTSAQIQIKNSAGAIGFRTLYYGPSYSGGSLFNVGANGTALYQEASAPLAVGTGAAQPLLFGTNGTERMRLDSSGNLGIGTSSPGAKLDVYDTGNSTLRISGSSGGGGDVSQIDFFRIGSNVTSSIKAIRDGSNTSGALTFLTAVSGVNTERMRITSAGKVGIGITGPTATLDVNGSFCALNNTDLPATTGGAAYYSGGFSSPVAGRLIFGDNTGWQYRFARRVSNTITDLVTIQDTGVVGIGTTSPSAVLHVKSSNGTIISETTAARNSNNNYLSFRDATGEAGFVGYGAGGANFYTWNNLNAALLFGTNNQERARISSGGVLSIGDTGTGDVTGAYIKATTITNANYGVVRIQSAKTADSADTALSVIKQANDSTTAQVFVRFVINAAANGCGQINANGANTAAFGTYSDARLKENIVDLPPQLASICALRPVEFDYIQSEGGGHQIGFIAQEMEQVYPDVVGERSDGMKTITAWSKTEARLVKAIQEQQAIIESLIARIAALEVKG